MKGDGYGYTITGAEQYTPLFRLFKGNDIAVGRHLLQMGERTYGIGKVFRKITLIISLLLLIAALLFLGKFLYTKI